jgi:hypothetical protein
MLVQINRLAEPFLVLVGHIHGAERGKDLVHARQVPGHPPQHMGGGVLFVDDPSVQPPGQHRPLFHQSIEHGLGVFLD